MADTTSLESSPYLPPEILDLIVQFLLDTEEPEVEVLTWQFLLHSRRGNLYSFCLVSRAWYGAGIV